MNPIIFKRLLLIFTIVFFISLFTYADTCEDDCSMAYVICEAEAVNNYQTCGLMCLAPFIICLNLNYPYWYCETYYNTDIECYDMCFYGATPVPGFEWYRGYEAESTYCQWGDPPGTGGYVGCLAACS